MEMEALPEEESSKEIKPWNRFQFNIPGKGAFSYTFWKIMRGEYIFSPNFGSREDDRLTRMSEICSTHQELFTYAGTIHFIVIPPSFLKTLIADGTIKKEHREPALTQLMPPDRLIPQPVAELSIETGVKQAEEAISALERLTARTYDLVKMANFQPNITRLMAVRGNISSSLYMRLVRINARLTQLHNAAPEKERTDLKQACKALNTLLSTLTN